MLSTKKFIIAALIFNLCLFADENTATTGKAVTGFADIHIHQMTEYAFGGGWLYGSHTGSQEEALCACSGMNDHGYLIGEGFLGIHLERTGGYPKFNGWPRWDSISHQQVHADWLKKAHEEGLNIIVMSAVNFEPLAHVIPEKHRVKEWGCSDIPAIKRQIEAAWRFDKEHDWYEIALSPADARRIIHEGKLAVVLAIETSDPFGDNDLVKQLDEYYEMGIRSLQPVHQLNNRFSGAAPHHPIFYVFQAIRNMLDGKDKSEFTNIVKENLAAIYSAGTWKELPPAVRQAAQKHMRGENDFGFKQDENGMNVVGLSEEGSTLINEMMKRNMLIDIAHMSQRAVTTTFGLSKSNKHYPLFVSHGHIREIMAGAKGEEEKSTSIEYAHIIASTGGMFGLRTGKDETLGYKKSPVKNCCHGSSVSFAQMYQFASRELNLQVAFASDLNGFITQILPRFDGKDACSASGFKFETKHQQQLQGDRFANGVGSDFDTKGFAHIGLIGDVIRDLNNLGVKTNDLENSAEKFIQMWERCYDESRRPVAYKVDLSKVKDTIEPYETKEQRKEKINK
ncbi:membrane dipeptidase [Candidatus Uabimicrobium sp. HlEnr_7]|uniref:membrane dipeptidase n=1 Tax=Candidatus Uabimicrobium helgolandensis TaxID=3095367 RepID=UPI0035566C93